MNDSTTDVKGDVASPPIEVTPENIAKARHWAGFYRSRGWNPLPSRPDAKRPLVRFAQYWDEPAPADLFDRHPTHSIQLMTGRRWRLLVIDLDGDGAREWFRSVGPPIPPTWVTHSGGDGQHLWFRLPEGISVPLGKAFLWRGDGQHEAVERLCDRSLVMVPPSIHPTTGERYRFVSPLQSPLRLPMPALCPAWILRLPPIAPPAPTLSIATPMLPAKAVPASLAGRYRSDAVLDAIGDKVALAASWGLRVASRSANGSGWCSCHAIGREDRTPSASISAVSGRYWESGEGRTISLFELAVRLGVYADWRDAVADLGSRFRAREVG